MHAFLITYLISFDNPPSELLEGVFLILHCFLFCIYLYVSGPAMARGPLAPGPKGGQSSPRRRRPAGCEACCACGSITACGGASDSWSNWQWGGSTGPRSSGHCRRWASWWAAPLPPLDGGGASCDCAASCLLCGCSACLPLARFSLQIGLGQLRAPQAASRGETFPPGNGSWRRSTRHPID